jgi:hypothetical protein
MADFDPKTFVASNSRLNTFSRCPKRYFFKYVEGWERREKKIQLERGSWLHKLLEVYYKGDDWKAAHKQLTKEFYLLFEEERIDLGDMPADCLRIFRSYLRTYQDDFKRYNVVDTELDETVTLPNGMKLRVIIDLILEDKHTGLLFAWDHKSRKSFADDENMVLDPQLTRYYSGLEILGYTPLGGVGYNELRTKPPAVPERLQRGGLSKRANIDTDVYTYMREIKRYDLDPNDYADILRLIATRQKGKFFRRTILPKDPPMLKAMLKETVQIVNQIGDAHRKDRFPRTFDNSCAWSCDFKDLCIADLHGANIAPLVKMNFTTREQRERKKKVERIKAKRRAERMKQRG